jgi:putative transcriptional regulator
MKNKTLGETIRELRGNRNMTQAELAMKSGLAESKISELESGHRNLDTPSNATLRTLEKIARALGCELQVLFVERKGKRA